MKNVVPFAILAFASLLSGPSQSTHAKDRVPLIGDIEAGKLKAVVCFGCHGNDGIGIAPNFPNIRGQKDVYLSKQLKYFRYRERDDPTMAAISQSLSDEDINNIAAYFYSLGNEGAPASTSEGAVEKSDVDLDQGKKKAAVCAACHGIDGISTQRNYPNLRGQQRGYLIKQFTAFRDGPRKDPIMTPMLKAFTDEDIANVAAYFSCLPHSTTDNRAKSLVACNPKPGAGDPKG